MQFTWMNLLLHKFLEKMSIRNSTMAAIEFTNTEASHSVIDYTDRHFSDPEIKRYLKDFEWVVSESDYTIRCSRYRKYTVLCYFEIILHCELMFLFKIACDVWKYYFLFQNSFWIVQYLISSHKKLSFEKSLSDRRQ